MVMVKANLVKTVTKNRVLGNWFINGPVAKVAVTESSTPGQGRVRVFLTSSAGTSVQSLCRHTFESLVQMKLFILRKSGNL